MQSLKTYYEKQSSGRYTRRRRWSPTGSRCKYNEARYGRSDGFPCDGNVCSNTWALIRDGIEPVGGRPEGGRPDRRTDQGRSGRLRQLGPLRLRRRRQLQRGRRLRRSLPDRALRWRPGRRRSVSGRGRHLVPPLEGLSVHLRTCRSDRKPRRGEGRSATPVCGWRDYTIQPENGGLSVFAHEYGHDLGLPDLYDTTGVGSDNAVGLVEPDGAEPAIGRRRRRASAPGPADLGAWEKLQLGWLDYETALAGERNTYQLGPHEYNSSKARCRVDGCDVLAMAAAIGVLGVGAGTADADPTDPPTPFRPPPGRAPPLRKPPTTCRIRRSPIVATCATARCRRC